jgi:hypothetical protein
VVPLAPFAGLRGVRDHIAGAGSDERRGRNGRMPRDAMQSDAAAVRLLQLRYVLHRGVSLAVRAGAPVGAGLESAVQRPLCAGLLLSQGRRRRRGPVSQALRRGSRLWRRRDLRARDRRLTAVEGMRLRVRPDGCVSQSRHQVHRRAGRDWGPVVHLLRRERRRAGGGELSAVERLRSRSQLRIGQRRRPMRPLVSRRHSGWCKASSSASASDADWRRMMARCAPRGCSHCLRRSVAATSSLPWSR